MTNEMIQKLMVKGAKRWTKGNMDRLYINISTLDEYYKANREKMEAIDIMRVPSFYGNRYERQNMKMFVDVKTGELVIQNNSAEQLRTVAEMWIAE